MDLQACDRLGFSLLLVPCVWDPLPIQWTGSWLRQKDWKGLLLSDHCMSRARIQTWHGTRRRRVQTRHWGNKLSVVVLTLHPILFSSAWIRLFRNEPMCRSRQTFLSFSFLLIIPVYFCQAHWTSSLWSMFEHQTCLIDTEQLCCPFMVFCSDQTTDCCQELLLCTDRSLLTSDWQQNVDSGLLVNLSSTEVLF